MSAGTLRPPEPVLFIDRDARSRALGEALNAAGIAYLAHHQRFAPDTPDTKWLAVAGTEGWLILTRDRRPAIFTLTRGGEVRKVSLR